ncbi:bifunctional phosphopantothenoylcysteine decarboxylase/phosphopantothenate--cysteine ligase CoaBC [Succinivibrio sp.]|uniref:bifunctional phosphopantothenoylcysteine decarboxylase/phosphopantothenate--cysteine ligase CoaBC n=1 Tax=Succinivibrio sp. TaxID=2053619 RepID=UPI00386516AE
MDTQLKNRKIVLGVTGGIAAYKACTLCRLLVKGGAQVYVVMTESATKLVGKETFEALSGHSVSVNIFEDSKDISHIALSNDADMIVVAPATANSIAKFAHGFADNMLCAVMLAANCKKVIAPAMNTNMYHNVATQENLQLLALRGMYILSPDSGDLACGTSGDGRMKEPEEIYEDILAIFSQDLEKLPHTKIGIENHQEKLPAPQQILELTQTKLLPKSFGAGFNVLITAGPTIEEIDPVRYITNHSSGKMGYALAHMAQLMGANVTLISGPVNLNVPLGVKRISVRSAVEMLNAVESYVNEADIFIGCAAVGDFRVESISKNKIKKKDGEEGLTLKLVQNPDIIATVGNREANRPFTVGFAAETDNLEENAKKKIVKKGLDMVILNDVSNKGIGFNSDDNEVSVYDKDGLVAHIEKQNKQVVATSLLELIFNAAKK